MTVYDVLGFDSLVGKEAIGGFEHGAVATGFGQRGPGILGQNGGEFYKALGASQVAEFRLGKFVDGPGGVIGQTAHTPFLCSGVILGRIQGFHARSIPPDTLKQKLWVTGSLSSPS